MIIGVDASRAFLKKRTGIEEYSYQVIRHLRDVIPEDCGVVLYLRSGQEVSFPIPRNWSVKNLWLPRLWTQVRLSLEMLFHPPDALFVPAHTVPIIHPKNTIVTVHGLEYEMFPGAYPFWSRVYMRLSIWFSSHTANQVVAVSENTKRDLMRLYGIPGRKVFVVYEGVSRHQAPDIGHRIPETKYGIPNTKYLLFIGRLEERKNVVRIIEAFDLLKERHHIPHTLVLAGKPGHRYEKIRDALSKTRFRSSIIETGYISEEEKWTLMESADAFLFPTLYEGFGLPILEAQKAGVPVVTSETSSLPEIAGAGASYCDPDRPESISDAIIRVLNDDEFRGVIIKEGRKNTERFGWRKCSEEIFRLFSF